MKLRSLLTSGMAALALLAATPAGAGVQFVYDSAGRLIKAIYTNGVTIEYRYDAAGNRTQIIAANAPNNAPVATADTAAVAASASVDIYVRTNDTDADGNSLTITAVGTPSGGSVAIMGSGTYVRFTAPSTAGVKTFTYTISDGAGGTATATVSVTVSSTNVAPVAVDDSAGATVDTTQSIFVRGNDTDANGDSLTVTAVSSVTGGSAVIAGAGAYVNYTAPSTPGTYTFDYTISDGHGGTDVGQVTVVVEAGEGCVPSSSQQCDIG